MRRKQLVCPNAECAKTFEKPIVLTDNLSIPRQTYYACPHCRSKLKIVVENGKFMKIVSVKKPDEVLTFPSGKKEIKEHCPYFFGYLKNLPEEQPIPDECLTCPKIIQCFVSKT